MKTKRLDLIESYVLEKKNVSLDALCDKFSVSKNTIRRDIDTIIKRGTIIKVYGGVSALEIPTPSPLLSYEERHTKLIDEKERICKAAASLVSDYDTIYIDTGTTCLHLVDYLPGKNCTIITNSLKVINKALPYPDINVISIPGKLNRKTLSFAGVNINSYLTTYNISKAFMACTGVTIKNGLTNATTEEYIVKKAIIENTDHNILLADHSKFGKISLMTYASIALLEHIITDTPLTSEYNSYCLENNINVIISGSEIPDIE